MNLKKSYDQKIIRTLKEMKTRYHNQAKAKQILKTKNPLIYTVYNKKQKTGNTDLTIMNPGTIGNEYYMTKGHRHKSKGKEKYTLKKGQGILLIQNKTSKIIILQKNKPITINGTSGHRLINTGKTKMEVITNYPKKTQKDYHFKFITRVLKDEPAR